MGAKGHAYEAEREKKPARTGGKRPWTGREEYAKQRKETGRNGRSSEEEEGSVAGERWEARFNIKTFYREK